MKRKQVNAAPKSVKQSKVAKKATQQKIKDVVEESDEVEVTVQEDVTTKEPKKNAVTVKEEPPQKDEVDEEEEDDDAEVAEEDDDEDPSEEPIGTEEPIIPSKVKSGKIPPTVPATRIVQISNLPKKCKQINIVEVFAKYGPIEQIHIVTTPVCTAAKIAYQTEKAALAALADDKKVKVMDSTVFINMLNEKKSMNALKRDRTVHVKNIKPGTTEEQISEHFESCGEVESVKMVTKFNATFAYVVFTDKSAMPAALKLHNSILNGSNIKVTENTENREIHVYNERLTIMLRNKQSFESIEVSKIESIFSKCGEITCIDLVCKKQVLAFITFKTEEAAQEGLQMSGTTLEDVELEIELYSPIKKWTSIHVVNLPKDCTEEELTNHFSKAGEIAHIILRKNFAIIRFNDCDGYCKSFLLNESFIRGQVIFIEPHSNRKHAIYKNKGHQKKGFIRHSENGHNSSFKAMKSKTN